MLDFLVFFIAWISLNKIYILIPIYVEVFKEEIHIKELTLQEMKMVGIMTTINYNFNTYLVDVNLLRSIYRMQFVDLNEYGDMVNSRIHKLGGLR